MKISLDTNHLKTLAGAESSSSSSTTSAETASDQVSLGNDHAELSMDHARVASLAAQVNNLPEIRQEKVSSLSDAIQSGDYNVSPQQTADAMLAEFLGNAA